MFTMNYTKIKTFAICSVALFAVAFARTVVEDIDYSHGEYDANESNFDNGIEQIDDKIVGGTDTTIDQHPHQIGLRIKGEIGIAHIGSASIISANRALAAGQTLSRRDPPARYSIQAGSTTVDGDANAQIRVLNRFLLHTQWNIPSPSLANDIALLFWVEPLTFGANVRPIRLPTANAAVPYGQKATTTGWGRIRNGGPYADNLRVVTLPLVSNEECNRAYKNENGIQPNMVCAGGEAGQGGCYGDAGGPLVYNNTLIGIMSFGRPCALADFPDVFARVAVFIDWINENIK